MARRDSHLFHVWWGMGLTDWLRLLARGRFQMAPWRWLELPLVTLCSLCNSLLGLLQTILYGRRVRQTELVAPPVFIVGHWRTGTTLLHELLSLDSRFTCPTTYECMFPRHCLLTERFMPKLIARVFARRRPMDNMRLRWDSPQEDEFALCKLGLPSPYLNLAFPNRPRRFNEYMDLQEVPPQDLRAWCDGLLAFLRGITMLRARRLVLKSPTHSYRIETLERLFPGAKFVHIVRDPFRVIPSTLHLWRRLSCEYGLQTPKFVGLQERVLDDCEHLYRAIEKGRETLGEGQFHEIRYEDLVREPVAEVARMYEQLDLGDFEALRPHIEDYFSKRAGYQVNDFNLDPDLAAQIDARFDWIRNRYGYK